MIDTEIWTRAPLFFMDAALHLVHARKKVRRAMVISISFM